MFSSSEKESREPLLPPGAPKRSKRNASKRKRTISLTILLILAIIDAALLTHFTRAWVSSRALTSSRLESCSWSSLKHHTALLDMPPIPLSEFLARQSALAAALRAAGLQALIAEPSASSSYYANVSAAFGLSERPFLLLVSAEGEISYLAPRFELGRIAGLRMAFDPRKGRKVMEWREEESPYAVLRRETGFGKVMVDEHGVGVEVVAMSGEVQRIRAVKSEAELAIMRGVNRFTLQVVRSLQGCITIGMSQEAVVSAARGLFAKAGIGQGFWAIVLFGEQAASPHGGSLGKTLADGEFVLIDIGSSLHGYGSDVTRTILPSRSSVSEELMEVWKTVHAAQGAAIELMKPNETCSVVDAASRVIIAEKGLGEFFTHRLGHGLGLEMHEHPYLHGANAEVLKGGEVVTNEPGVYVTTEQARQMSKDVGFGVRIEDAVLVTESGGVVMTGARARSPWEP